MIRKHNALIDGGDTRNLFPIPPSANPMSWVLIMRSHWYANEKSWL